MSKEIINTVEIRINDYLTTTNVEGPGSRFCIWVQGCSIHCNGCANKALWNKNGGTTYDTKEMIDLIVSFKDKIEGITFLGGEPLDQIEAITEISKAVREIGLSVLVFTGYVYEEIKDKAEIQELINFIDILIDGKYEEDKQDFSRAWVGSSNQKYYFFTDKYDESVITQYKNKIELRISPNNSVVMNGMGDFKKVLATMR